MKTGNVYNELNWAMDFEVGQPGSTRNGRLSSSQELPSTYRVRDQGVRRGTLQGEFLEVDIGRDVAFQVHRAETGSHVDLDGDGRMQEGARLKVRRRACLSYTMR